LHCIEGSDLRTGKIKTRVQDAWSMRSTPQVIGAGHDAVAWARDQVEIELNAVADNPIFLPEHRLTLTGTNFQGSPVSLPMDMVGAGDAGAKTVVRNHVDFLDEDRPLFPDHPRMMALVE